MIFETVTTITFGGIAAYSYFKSEGPAVNDSEKILKIFNNAGWKKGNETIRILKKRKIEGGMEYVFQTPLGLGSRKIIENKDILEDGINTRATSLKFSPKDFLNLKFDKTILSQVKSIFTEKEIVKKEMDIEYEGGVLKIRVYHIPSPDEIIWNEELLKPGTWSVIIGLTRNKMFYHDFDKTKHLIIAGVPGSGKSVVMKLIITSLLLSQPNNVTFSLIDLKGGPAFARFKDCKQVENFAVNNSEALCVLKKVEEDMERVYRDVLVAKDFEDITEAGIKERHFLVIDEAADLAGDKEAVEILTNIVRKGRGSGHYVIYATQYPTVQTVASQIKRNIPARLTYVLDSAIASNAVLDTNGAEDLPETPGRGIYKMTKQAIIQTPYMSNKKIDELIKPFKIEKKDDDHGETIQKPNEDRKHTIEFIPAGLSEPITNSRNARSKKRP